MKDYYKIMDVPYDASQVEIRTAYHKLAKKYHPDKNPNNESTALAFLEIQEAYFVLSDEERRQQFHLRSKYPFTVRTKAAVETPETILNKARKLNRLLKEIDVFRMNHSIYTQAVDLLLSEPNISVLKSAQVKAVNQLLVEEILKICRLLSYREALRIANKLSIIAGNNEATQKAIHRFTNQKRVRNVWDQYNPVIIILVTLIICLLILILNS